MAISNIANIASLDLVDRITLIDTIATITNIDEIDKINVVSGITAISNAIVHFQPIRNYTFADGFNGWMSTDYVGITTVNDNTFGKSVKFSGTANTICQYVSVSTNIYSALVFYAYKTTGAGRHNIRRRFDFHGSLCRSSD